MATYRAGARQRQQRELAALAAREQRAWELARQAAVLLRTEFHAGRVLVFGSLIHPGCFTPWSDVDIAADGIDPRDTLRAMESVHDLSREIPVNLVDLAACKPSLRAVVDREGQPL
jgi:predicted nucleotidyltransferase